jgi:hypothetical protein
MAASGAARPIRPAAFVKPYNSLFTRIFSRIFRQIPQ